MTTVIVRVRYRVAAAPEPRTQRRADWGLCARLWGLRAYAHPARIREFFEAVLRAPRSLFHRLLTVRQDTPGDVSKKFHVLSFGAAHVEQSTEDEGHERGTIVQERGKFTHV